MIFKKEHFNGFTMSQVIASESGVRSLTIFTHIKKGKIVNYYHVKEKKRNLVEIFYNFEEAIEAFNKIK